MYRGQRGVGEYFLPVGMGEYFAANGMGEYFSGVGDDAPPAVPPLPAQIDTPASPDATAQANAEWAGAFAAGGALVGLLSAVAYKKNKFAGLGIGALVGLGASYLVPVPTTSVTPAAT